MRHEPERLAAAYLAGELGRRQRERFEAHILACDECWQEVGLGRRGRALGESLREVAPQRLRERVRVTVAATPPGRRRAHLPGVLAATAAVLAAVVAGGLLPAGPASPP